MEIDEKIKRKIDWSKKKNNKTYKEESIRPKNPYKRNKKNFDDFFEEE